MRPSDDIQVARGPWRSWQHRGTDSDLEVRPVGESWPSCFLPCGLGVLDPLSAAGKAVWYSVGSLPLLLQATPSSLCWGASFPSQERVASWGETMLPPAWVTRNRWNHTAFCSSQVGLLWFQGALPPSSNTYSSIYQCLKVYLKREEAFKSTIRRLQILFEITFHCHWVFIKIQSVNNHK